MQAKMMLTRFSLIPSLILLSVVFTSGVFSQHEVGEVKIEKKSPPKPVFKRPPRVTTKGALVVLTDPPQAGVTIRDSRGRVVKQAGSRNGELQVELPPGKYDLDVTADKYQPFTMGKGILVTASRIRTVQAFLKPTTGSMVISGVNSDTTVLIDDKKPADLNIKVEVKKDENQIVFDDVPEGFHTLKITGPSIADWERENVKVEGGSITTVSPKLQRVTAKLTVITQPNARVYFDGVFLGFTSDKGDLKRDDIPIGEHRIRVEKDSFEPVDRKLSLTAGSTEIAIKGLNPIKRSPEFADYFKEGLTYWDAPKTWQVNRGKLIVSGPGAGLVQGKLYDDFEMVFDISFSNAKGAVWIVRALDEKNYYLFILTGPKAASPQSFFSYLYENGQLKQLDFARVFDDLSRPNDQYTITIKANGPVIKHFLQLKSSPTASPRLLGTLTDRTFSYGTVGFISLDGEEFAVYDVVVLPFDK